VLAAAAAAALPDLTRSRFFGGFWASDAAGWLAAAGYRVLDDGEGPPRRPRPAPAQRRLLAAADRQIQYVSPVPISR